MANKATDEQADRGPFVDMTHATIDDWKRYAKGWVGLAQRLEREQGWDRATITAQGKEIATLKAEVERLRGRESELVDRLSCIYSSLEDMWLADDFGEGFHEDSTDESTLVRYSLFTGEVWMIHKILAPLRRTRQECFLRQSGGDNGK